MRDYSRFDFYNKNLIISLLKRDFHTIEANYPDNIGPAICDVPMTLVALSNIHYDLWVQFQTDPTPRAPNLTLDMLWDFSNLRSGVNDSAIRGDNTRLELMSREMYERHFVPWQRAIRELSVIRKDARKKGEQEKKG